MNSLSGGHCSVRGVDFNFASSSPAALVCLELRCSESSVVRRSGHMPPFTMRCARVFRCRINDLNTSSCLHVDIGPNALLPTLARLHRQCRVADGGAQILRFVGLDQILNSTLRVCRQILRFQNRNMGAVYNNSLWWNGISLRTAQFRDALPSGRWCHPDAFAPGDCWRASASKAAAAIAERTGHHGFDFVIG